MPELDSNPSNRKRTTSTAGDRVHVQGAAGHNAAVTTLAEREFASAHLVSDRHRRGLVRNFRCQFAPSTTRVWPEMNRA